MSTITLRAASFEAIKAQAEREYPNECCGFVIGNDRIEEVRPIENIQNQKHAGDPQAFPRDARTAYLMEPRQHLAVLRELDDRALRLRLVYHSHPDHDAYFSQTDRRQACSFSPDSPDYPDTGYLVVSVKQGVFARAALYTWDEASKDFVESDLSVR
jgi:proteasome lid subunit RPN8/RPN11